MILIAGDSDFVPAAKLARREGIDIVLDPMGAAIAPDMNEHIDGRHNELRALALRESSFGAVYGAGLSHELSHKHADKPCDRLSRADEEGRRRSSKKGRHQTALTSGKPAHSIDIRSHLYSGDNPCDGNNGICECHLPRCADTISANVSSLAPYKPSGRLCADIHIHAIVHEAFA